MNQLIIINESLHNQVIYVNKVTHKKLCFSPIHCNYHNSSSSNPSSARDLNGFQRNTTQSTPIGQQPLSAAPSAGKIMGQKNLFLGSTRISKASSTICCSINKWFECSAKSVINLLSRKVSMEEQI